MHEIPTEKQEKQNKEQQKENVQRAMAALSEIQKEVFLLKYNSNLTIAEISEICQCSEGTVKSRLFYAMKILRAQLVIEKNKEA